MQNKEKRPLHPERSFYVGKLAFVSHHLVDAALMTLVMGELGTQPGVDDLESQHLADNSGTDRHHVGVVVLGSCVRT